MNSIYAPFPPHFWRRLHCRTAMRNWTSRACAGTQYIDAGYCLDRYYIEESE